MLVFFNVFFKFTNISLKYSLLRLSDVKNEPHFKLTKVDESQTKTRVRDILICEAIESKSGTVPPLSHE